VVDDDDLGETRERAEDAASEAERTASEARERVNQARGLVDSARERGSRLSDAAESGQIAERTLGELDGIAGGIRDGAGLAGAHEVGEVANTVRQVAGVARGTVAAARVVGSAIDAIASGLRDAEYGFTADGQDEAAWQVETFRLTERMNETYECRLQLTTEDPTATGNELLGKSCLLRIERGSQVRNVRGIVARVEQRSGGRGTRAVRVRVVPALYALGQNRNSRIFQEMNALDILEEVLGQGLQAYGRELRVTAEASNYATREYCVQYRESDLAFALRVMAEEGIGCHFVHDESDAGEIFVLTDSNDQFRSALSDDRALQVLSRSDEHGDRQSVRDFDVQSRLTPTGTVVRDYDWTRPSLECTEGEAGSDEQGRAREIYEHESPVRFSDYSEPSFAESNAARQAELRQQAESLRQQIARGSGDCNLLEPGTTFSIEGHPNSELDQAYVVVAVTHRGSVHVEDDQRRYENEFECIPSTVRFVPPRSHARPAMPGYCTATVVGPEGEEIHTDVHGRVRVRFHWDRGDTPPEQASCWIRVCQSWAGPGYGCMFVPRVGQEIVVQFEGGNLDRPLCTGTVYNGENTPPLQLPDERTQSVIRTQTSPGGNGFNEIRLEDRAGEENLSMHAQRDHTIAVLHDETRSVGNDYTLDVTKNTGVSIGGDLSWTVGGKQDCTNKGLRKDFFTSGRESTVVDHENVVVHGTSTLKVTSTFDLESDVHLKIHVGDDPVIEMIPQLLNARATAITLSAQNMFVIECGASKILLTPSNIVIQSPQVLVESLTGSKVELIGGRALVDAPTEAKVHSGGSSYTVDPSGAKGVGTSAHAIEGGEVTITNAGGANVKLVGPEVKLND
jgi:type VI secretion system secreted protein VgrG